MDKTIYALLVGINGYQHAPLQGCVNDVIEVKQFFERLVAVNKNITSFQPKLLLAPEKQDNSELAIDLKALEAANLSKTDYNQPTRKNILEGFNHFNKAKTGDICIFYYSGHGSFQSAPREFWHLKPTRQVETIIASDSRQRDGRDIIDKELGYQIWSTMQNKVDVHFLVIMDCCHAGDNTRGNEGVRVREDRPNQNITLLQDYYGFQEEGNSFYQLSTDKKKIDIPFGTHIHLAAARENESAKEKWLEGKPRGVFTHALLKILDNGGLQCSYEELIERTRILVENKVDNQIPTIQSYGIDTELSFLNSALIPTSKSHLIFYNNEEEAWQLNAGAMQGITPKSRLVVIDKEGQPLANAETKACRRNISTLELDQPLETLVSDTLLKGRMTSLNAPLLKIGLAATLEDSEKEALKEAISKKISLKITPVEIADYVVRPIYSEATNPKEQYILTKVDSLIPIFKRQPTINTLMLGIEAVANWSRLLEAAHPSTSIKRREIEITIDTIEGKTITKKNIDKLKVSKTLKNPISISLAYKKPRGREELAQPAIRINIKCKGEDLFVVGFYLNSQFGITKLLDTTVINTNDEGVSLSCQYEGKIGKTIPLTFNEKYHELGVTEITNYLKLFVAKQYFRMDNFEQEDLPLDVIRKRRRRVSFEGKEDVDDWITITIPIKIYRPQSEKDISSADISFKKSISIEEMIVEAPKGFSAKIAAASNDHVRALMGRNRSVRRSANSTKIKLNTSLLPPATLWGNGTSDGMIMGRSTLGTTDTQLSILEFDRVEGELSEENPLTIQTTGLSEEEAIIPFGYDPATNLYIPTGFTDENGVVRIEQLPSPTIGKIFNAGTINQRSIGNSIKLFLKKIIWNPLIGDTALNQLQLCEWDEEKQTVTRKPITKGYLADTKTYKNIALLIHGIIGKTDPIVNGVYVRSDIHQSFNAVLTFDYENLNSPIKETAKDLAEKLDNAGVFAQRLPRLTIIAHSMGGLVSRSMIEQLGKKDFIKKLILLGTPNGGSEIDEFRKSLTTGLIMAMNGLTKFKPYIPILTALGKKVGKQVFVTLSEMNPSSNFLKELNKEADTIDTSNYYLIAGNTALIKVKHKPNDPFWFIFIKAIRQKAHYLAISHLIFSDVNNDMAVRLALMKAIFSNAESQVSILPTDHLSYFLDDNSLRQLKEWV